MHEFNYCDAGNNDGPLLILDRDSTLIVDHGYTWQIKDLEFIPGALESLRFAQENDVTVAIATNQSGLGKGLFTLEQYTEFSNNLVERVLSYGGRISFIATCPHIPEDLCICRKPLPGLIVSILERFNRGSQSVLLLGNSETDVKAGESVGVKSKIAVGEEIEWSLKDWLEKYDQH